MTQFGLTSKKNGYLAVSDVKVPAETIAWMDAWGSPDKTTSGGNATGWCIGLNINATLNATQEPYKSSLERHDGKFNVLYFDGHAAATTVATCGGTDWTKLPWAPGSDRYPEK
jgi:prepilin-type processing-associated H-X9-DG protein